MKNTLTYLDFFMLIIGACVLFTTLRMKKTGVIPSMFLAKEEQDKVKDSDRFIAMIFPKLFLLSAAMVILGSIGMISILLVKIPFYSYFELIAFFAFFFLFMKDYQQARSECIDSGEQ